MDPTRGLKIEGLSYLEHQEVKGIGCQIPESLQDGGAGPPRWYVSTFPVTLETGVKGKTKE